MAESSQGERPIAPSADEAASYGRCVDAGFAVGGLLIEAGYVPSLRHLARVFERLYWQYIPAGTDRPDLRTRLAGGFLEGIRQTGFEPPDWMKPHEWSRAILSFDEPVPPH